METTEQFSEPVDVLQRGDRTFYLVGTAHISKASAELANEVIAKVQPDSVAVELCEPRYKSLKEPDRWRNTDLFSVIRDGNSYVLAAQLILATFQKKLGDHLNIRPGDEMMRAVRAAEEHEACVILADREIKTTLRRTWRALGGWSMFKIVHALLTGLFTDKKMSAEEIENLKSQGNLDALLREFSAAFPRIKESLIGERDRYLAAKIYGSPGETVVAVVGAGHVPGIKEWLGKEIDLKELETIPQRGPIARLLRFIIPASVVLMIVLAFTRGNTEQGVEMARAWFWVNGISAAAGALAALAHPLTIAAVFITAPFTSLNPFMRTGWIGGLVETMLRKPTVSDLETVAKDIASVKGIWKNGVSRILLLVLLVNLFSLLGALYGVKAVASLL